MHLINIPLDEINSHFEQLLMEFLLITAIDTRVESVRALPELNRRGCFAVKKIIFLSIVVAGDSLPATGAMAALPDGAGQPTVVRFAQMDSPEDGLD